MPLGKKSLFGKSSKRRRRQNRNRSIQGNENSDGGDGVGGVGMNRRHGHHRQEPNIGKMIFYFLIIIINFWYQRRKRNANPLEDDESILESSNVDGMNDGSEYDL
jgi:hypothetical protein